VLDVADGKMAVNDELEGIWKEAVETFFLYYSNVNLVGFKKVTECLGLDNRSQGRESNPGPTKYKVEVS
jgi:hypothetical protein